MHYSKLPTELPDVKYLILLDIILYYLVLLMQLNQQLWKIPLSDNTMGRRILDISEDFCEQLIVHLKAWCSSLQVDEAMDVLEDTHLITYV
jgi:hypothetical protein